MRFCISHLRWAFLLLVALAGLVSGGCATTESDNLSERPWSAPQSWETGLPSGMYDQRR